MSIMELSQEALEQVNGGYVFCPDEMNRPMEWEVISDFDGSVLERVHGWREDAQARAKQLGMSKKQLNWTQLNCLRTFGHAFAIGG